MTNLDHIHPEFRHIAGLSNEDRISFVKDPRWIGYTHANDIIDLMLDLMRAPKKARMDNLLIIGDPNNGKTTIIDRFYALYGEGHVDSEAEAHKPVIVAQSPPFADIKGLYIAILERFFAKYRTTDSIPKLMYQVIHLMRYCHVKILVIDELHSMLSGSAMKQREVMNAIKSLCNELKIPIVGVGTSDSVQMLHHDPQHASRFSVISLKRWKLDQNFQKLLKSFESVLPLREASKLHTPQTARILHSLSEGIIGNLHHILMKSAVHAIETGAESISETTIASIRENEITNRYEMPLGTSYS